MAIGEDSYTSVFNKIRYLIACTDCDREDIRKLEKELEGYSEQYNNGEIDKEKLNKLSYMVQKKEELLHDTCKTIEWVNQYG